MSSVSPHSAACLLIVGNELLTGQIQDANLRHVAVALLQWGLPLLEARVIPDHPEAIVEAVNETRARYRAVLVTGGLGSTHDDVTAQSIADAFGVPLVVRDEIAAIIRQNPVPDAVRAVQMRMARVPEGSELIDNPTGGPHGFRIGNVFVMAGIPHIMRAMLSTLEGALSQGPPILSFSIVAYLAESTISDALRALQAEHPDISIGSYPFEQDGRFGVTLVVRGAHSPARLAALEAIRTLVTSMGVAPHD